ncbi:hypothetical protein QTO01_19455 [Vibrio mytili]|uniref:hypothetical protein n=1 Tax=Vibrio mytili TaxID=50718 RepID=UPI002F3F0A88
MIKNTVKILPLAILLAACGGGDGSDNKSTPSTTDAKNDALVITSSESTKELNLNAQITDAEVITSAIVKSVMGATLGQELISEVAQTAENNAVQGEYSYEYTENCLKSGTLYGYMDIDGNSQAYTADCKRFEPGTNAEPLFILNTRVNAANPRDSLIELSGPISAEIVGEGKVNIKVGQFSNDWSNNYQNIVNFTITTIDPNYSAVVKCEDMAFPIGQFPLSKPESGSCTINNNATANWNVAFVSGQMEITDPDGNVTYDASWF